MHDVSCTALSFADREQTTIHILYSIFMACVNSGIYFQVPDRCWRQGQRAEAGAVRDLGEFTKAGQRTEAVLSLSAEYASFKLRVHPPHRVPRPLVPTEAHLAAAPPLSRTLPRPCHMHPLLMRTQALGRMPSTPT